MPVLDPFGNCFNAVFNFCYFNNEAIVNRDDVLHARTLEGADYQRSFRLSSISEVYNDISHILWEIRSNECMARFLDHVLCSASIPNYITPSWAYILRFVNLGIRFYWLAILFTLIKRSIACWESFTFFGIICEKIMPY